MATHTISFTSFSKCALLLLRCLGFPAASPSPSLLRVPNQARMEDDGFDIWQCHASCTCSRLGKKALAHHIWM